MVAASPRSMRPPNHAVLNDVCPCEQVVAHSRCSSFPMKNISTWAQTRLAPDAPRARLSWTPWCAESHARPKVQPSCFVTEAIEHPFVASNRLASETTQKQSDNHMLLDGDRLEYACASPGRKRRKSKEKNKCGCERQLLTRSGWRHRMCSILCCTTGPAHRVGSQARARTSTEPSLWTVASSTTYRVPCACLFVSSSWPLLSNQKHPAESPSLCRLSVAMHMWNTIKNRGEDLRVSGDIAFQIAGHHCRNACRKRTYLLETTKQNMAGQVTDWASTTRVLESHPVLARAKQAGALHLVALVVGAKPTPWQMFATPTGACLLNALAGINIHNCKDPPKSEARAL